MSADPTEKRMDGGGSGAWIRSNLAALGSAAVLAVYGAGYVRTRSAAQRFAGEDAERRVATAPRAPVPPLPLPDRPPPARPAIPASGRPAAKRPGTAARQSTDPKDVARIAPESARVVDSVLPAPAPVAAAPAPPPAPPAAQVADSSAQPPDKPRAQWKDGVYFGYGTSRHGDIEASVEVNGGRITAAYISRCLTRYSCSWIAALPPQVLTRQSADVDYVSGATESTNAFYYAIVQALSKAK